MNDDDLIRRGDAVLAVTAADKECLGANGAREFIRAIPAATPALDAAAMQRMAAGEASRYVQMRSDQIATEKAKTAHCVDVAQVMRWEAGRIQASSIADAILALPLPTPADRLADALGVPEDWHQFVLSAIAEADRAMRKFPQPNYVISKVAEEAGEVVKAAIHCAEGRENPENVRGEMRQLVAMLYRLWVEGDQVHGLPALRRIAEGEE